MRTRINTLKDEMRTQLSTRWNGIKTTIIEKATEIGKSAYYAFHDMRTGINTLKDGMRAQLRTRWDGMVADASSRAKALRDKVMTPIENIRDRVRSAWNNLLSHTDGKWGAISRVIKNTLNVIIGILNKFIRSWNRIKLDVPRVYIPTLG